MRCKHGVKGRIIQNSVLLQNGVVEKNYCKCSIAELGTNSYIRTRIENWFPAVLKTPLQKWKKKLLLF